ncbi:MAG: N-acetylmuramoyl-L-alanine amidase [Candidatus Saganbacteria bacterium]|nr:N-acetylmuramoyl-L-alanine amidase [Candidatus Saganbacteria bacterium]
MGKSNKFDHFCLRLVICLCLVSCILYLGNTSVAQGAEISKIEAKRDRGFDYLDVYTTGNVSGNGLLLENELQINFPNAKISPKIEILTKKSKRIKNISTKQVGSTARITVTLKKNIDYEIVNVFGRNKAVVEISDRLDYTERIMAAWEKANLKRSGQKLEPYKYAPIASGKDKSLKGKIIVIDPGHGGKDPGAFSYSGMAEKHFTLATAKKIAHHLKTAGATVYLTRTSDRTCRLQDIVAFANKVGADMFISIHYNYGYNRKFAGTETYYYTPRSRKLALAIHQRLKNELKRKDRGLRRAMFYTIHHARMPAVLIEPVYISNKKEEKLAGSQNFQEKIAISVTRGVKSYF